MAYNQLNIDISQYCPGTILKWRAREANGPLTATYTVTVPGNVALAVTPSASPASVCIGECTDLSAVTTGSCGNNLTYSWSNGAGNGQTVNVCPIENTSYTVTVTDPRDICGALTATNTVTVNLEPPLSVGIASIQPAVVCVGDDASLTIPGAVGDIQWQTSSSGAPPWTDIPGATTTTYTYAGAIVNAFFRAEVSNACQTDHSNVVDLTVLELPSSNFSFTTVCEGNSTSFEHLLQPDVISWQWEFGDNNGISALPDPGYTYTQFGFYDVTLIVTGSNGCVATLTETIEVYPNPIADFLFDSVCFPLPIQFTDQSLDNGAYSITQWSWDFTDNQTTIQQSPLMTFPVFGAYGATLTVTNSVGCQSEVTLDDALVHPLPVADFDANLQQCNEDEMTLTDQSTVDLLSNDAITTWSYNLGDGASINTPDGQYTYAIAGTYDVQLLVTTNNSCLDSITQTVAVNPLPVYDLAISDVCQEVLFTPGNNSSVPGGVLDSTIWDIDGVIYTDVEPQHVFSTYGIKNISLRLISDLGCVVDTTFQMEVYPKPSADFETDNICAENTLVINDLSSVPAPGQLVVSDWILTDGTVYTYNTLTSNVFTNYGMETITLAVETQQGCQDTALLDVYIHPIPESLFSFSNICESDSAVFTDQSTVATGLVAQWDWDFDNGQQSGLQQPPVQGYPADGFYDVVLTVESDSGCVATSTETIEVYPNPIADFLFDSVCFPLPIQFTDQSLDNGAYSITQWSWDFTDNQTTIQQSPLMTFPVFGAYGATLTVTNSVGCQSEVTLDDALVHPLPVADFDANLQQCNEDEMTLTDQSTVDLLSNDAITTWSYNLGDGASINTPDGQYTYAIAGTYDVQLLVTTNNSCLDSITQTVAVNPLPVYDLAISDVCQEVLFTPGNNSSVPGGVLDSTIWDIDGVIYTDVEPQHVFSTYGIKNISLRLISDLGCVVDTTFQMEVYPKPSADFETDNICAENTLVINDLSSVPAPGQLVVSDWILTDGTVYTYNTLTSNVFTNYGMETITLAVETQQGCQDTALLDVYIHPIPESLFSFSNICESDSAVFTDQSTVATGLVAQWDWDFDNGQQSGLQQPPVQGYPADGFYDVVLTVESDSGCVATSTETIEVYPNPIADFTFDSVCFPLPIQFTDQSLDNGAYGITQWAWTFTDGQNSTLQSPLMAFPVFGAYGATLTVTNSVGCKVNVLLGDALVHPMPVAGFDANLEHCYLDILAVTDMSTVDLLSNDVITTWEYTLGDGASISTPDGQHNYASAGFYDVQLLVTTNHSCLDSMVQTVEVYPLPLVEFSALPEEGCDPLAVQFLDVSSITTPYTLASWEWDLGVEGQTPEVQNPFYVYNPDSLGALDAATYDVALTVTSGNGCVDSLLMVDYITVHPLPDAVFSTDPERVTNIIDPVFSLTDLSTANVVAWNWNFGNGQQSWEQNPVSAYSDTGSYVIELIVETPYGCFDTVSYTVQVEPNFTFHIPNSFTPNGDGVNDYFFGIGEYIKNYRMEIYDRWGELIFLSSNMEYSWDGRYKGKDVQQGQYVSKFYVTDWANEGHEYIGSVRLHR